MPLITIKPNVSEAIKQGDWVRTKPAHPRVAGVVKKINGGVVHVAPHDDPHNIVEVPLSHFKESSDFNEAVTALPDNLSLEDTLVELHKRFEAAKRGIGIVNKIKDKKERRKHFSAIRGNMNSIQAALVRVTKQLDKFEKASLEYDNGDTYVREESLHEDSEHHEKIQNFANGLKRDSKVHSIVIKDGKLIFRRIDTEFEIRSVGDNLEMYADAYGKWIKIRTNVKNLNDILRAAIFTNDHGNHYPAA